MSRAKIQAMIQLLDDPSVEVHQEVTKSLLDQGTAILPDLEAAWEGSLDRKYQDKVVGLIQEIQMQSTHVEMKRWLAFEQHDLLKGVYLLAKYRYPDLTFREMEDSMDKIINDVWLELNNNLTALEKVRILNHILFYVHGFSRNTKDFYNPRDSFINHVLKSRRGNQVSLSVVYSIVAQRLGLPVYGVNLPKNFILAYKDQLHGEEAFDDIAGDILFYINPYNRGAVLGRKEIDRFLRQQKIKSRQAYYLPCSNPRVVFRMVQNLIRAYQMAGQKDKALQFGEVLGILPPEEE